MGSPKKQRKKYSTPRHPWQGLRIEEERELTNEYGLKNKKEIWKAISLLRNFKNQAKGKGSKPEEQMQKEQKLLLDKLAKLNILPDKAKLDNILSLSIKDILERRLQTLVFRQNLSRSVKQARQFIIHGHIQVNGIKMNVPSYLISKDEESKIKFVDASKLNDKDHPERAVKVEKTKLTKEAKKKEVKVQKEKVKKKEKEIKKEDKKKPTKSSRKLKTSQQPHDVKKKKKKPTKKKAKKKEVKK